MQELSSSSLGAVIVRRRQQLHLSRRALAKSSGVPLSTLERLETDEVDSPNPANLSTLAAALDVPLADLYAAAGIDHPVGLPSFTPYLRSKYAKLPEAARRELEATFERIASKYGYDGDGPEPGEDEH